LCDSPKLIDAPLIVGKTTLHLFFLIQKNLFQRRFCL